MPDIVTNFKEITYCDSGIVGIAEMRNCGDDNFNSESGGYFFTYERIYDFHIL